MARITAVLVAGVLTLTACGEDPVGPICGCEEITIVPQEAEVAVGDSVQFSARAQTVGDGEPEVLWSVGDTTVAVVDSTGTAFGRAPGTTTVTASVAGRPDMTASAQVIVVDSL